MIAQPTASEIRMKQQMRDIYRALTTCGFPGLINKSVAKEEREIEELLSDYFQPTPNREALIQWLIMQVFPLYQPEGNKIDKKGNKTKKILACLWRLGVLPYSKHTKNLDYQKYVLGLIGQQNAITLIFNLCTLLIESKRAIKSRQDNQFHYFLQDIYKNYDSLINLDYDPYKVSFPPAYHQLSQQEFDQKYAILLLKINKLKTNPTIDQQINNEFNFQRVFKQFQSNKQDFIKAYEDLSIKIRRTIEEHQSMIQPWKKDMNEQLKGRTLNISSHLPALYRKYKEKIKLNLIGSSKVGEQALEISKLVASLNSQVQI